MSDSKAVNRFALHIERPRALLIAQDSGIETIVALVESLRTLTDVHWQPLVLMEAEQGFPFRAKPSTLIVSGIPEGVIASMPLLEGWRIPSRLASKQDQPGCFDGSVIELAITWLEAMDRDALNQVEIFSCGSNRMLEIVTHVAERFDVPCQCYTL